MVLCSRCALFQEWADELAAKSLPCSLMSFYEWLEELDIEVGTGFSLPGSILSDVAAASKSHSWNISALKCSIPVLSSLFDGIYHSSCFRISFSEEICQIPISYLLSGILHQI